MGLFLRDCIPYNALQTKSVLDVEKNFNKTKAQEIRVIIRLDQDRSESEYDIENY